MLDGAAAVEIGPRPDQDGTAPAAVAYVVVACTLRSGSNLLCEVLRRNGFGEPKEWFQAAPDIGPGAHLGHQSDNLERQTRDFLAAHATASWRGVKLDWRQYQYLRGAAPGAPAAAPLLRGMMDGRWIFLRRRDLAAQAVSLYAAQITGAWMGEDTADYERVPQDFDAIYERFAALAADEFSWENYFRGDAPAPTHVYHEDLLAGGSAAWENLVRGLAPDFDLGQLDLGALQPAPRRHERLRALKVWFHEQLASGRRPRSPLALMQEIGRMVARIEQTPLTEGVIGRFAADRIASPAGFRLRKLDLDRDLQREGSATVVAQDHFIDRVALRLDPDATCRFVGPATRVMLQFYAHAWSGVAEIRIGDALAELDLFSQRADTRHFIRDLPAGFSGSVTVRSSGAKHLLSNGHEVWLQRVLVLDAGPG